MDSLLIVIAVAAAYLLGSIPTAYLMARRRRGLDIRTVGSRNMGAMNVFYKVGVREGLIVLAVDIGKGMLAVAIAKWLNLALPFQLLVGAVAILGHIFPVWLGFKGGTGGAACIGVLACLMPWGIPLYAAAFGLMMLLTRFPTLSYSAAFLVYPFLGWYVYQRWELMAFSLGVLLLPGIRYIRRIIEMRVKGGSWQHVFVRKSLKDRL
jgi:acyl phosphate:glycerol-3-phosphate acyltransferase